MSLVKLPHEVPVEQNTFVSSYDSTYQPKRAQTATCHSSKEHPLTGHLNNETKPYRPLAFGPQVSTAHGSYQKAIIAPMPVPGGKKHATAHTRNQSAGPASQHQKGEFRSTMKASFVTPGPPPPGATFRYPGSQAVKYNPNFLKIESPPDVSKPKFLPPPVPGHWSSRRDGQLHIQPNAKLDVEERRAVVRPSTTSANLSDRHTELTAAARMGGLNSTAGLIDEPFDGTTTYRHFMVNQWKLPEPKDPGSYKKTKAELTVRLNKYPVSYASVEALEKIRGSDGRLVSERPPGVHPTIWRLQVEKERSKI